MKIRDGEVFYDIKTNKEVFFVSNTPKGFNDKFIICHDGNPNGVAVYEIEYLLNHKQYRDYKISKLLIDGDD